MSALLPVWLRGVAFGSHGDIYTVDSNNSWLEKHVCCDDGIWYNRPLRVKLSAGPSSGARPLAVAFLDSQDDQKKRILVTMDNKILVFLSADLTVQDQVKLKGRCSGIIVAKVPLSKGTSPDPTILLLNATDNSLDLLNSSGERIQAIPLPQKLGLRETHGYLTCCQIEGRIILVISSSRGVYSSILYRTESEEWAIQFSDEILADDQFTPQGVCLVNSFLYIANNCIRKNRVMKMKLVCRESDDVSMEYVTYMSVTSPCALHGRQLGDNASVCVTTLTGRYELLDF